MRNVLLLAAVALVLGALLVQRHAVSAPGIVASPTMTPGALNPDVSQANIRDTICAAGWTKTIRPPTEYTNQLKVRQMRAYGETGDESDYQEDHMISLELGGAPTDPRN